MASTTTDWPPDCEWVYAPSPEELETERRYWQDLDRIAEYDAWIELQAQQATSYEGWTAQELTEELETVRTLTPDRDDVIDALLEALRALDCVEAVA